MKLFNSLAGLLLAFVLPLSSAESQSLLIQLNIDHAEQLIPVLDKYYQNLSKEIPYSFLIACHIDEQSLADSAMQEKLKAYPNLTIIPCVGKSKVEAANYAFSKFVGPSDILFISSEYLEPSAKNYDKTILEHFKKHFPDGDGVLNIFSEGKESINGAPIIGRPYFQRFGYIYNPIYDTSHYDQEMTFVSRILGKEMVINAPILKASSQIKSSTESKKDAEVFAKRRDQTFGISNEELRKIFPKDWSILICTLDERVKQFTDLYNKLNQQIKDAKLEDRVEIVVFKDNRTHTVGSKRNALLRQSKGMYVNFIDDDDDVHDNYISMIYEKLKNEPDNVSLVGVITFNDNNPAKFIHSVKFNNYFQANGVYFRPPNHLNPMKRSVAAQFLFPEISYGEDTDWAMRIARSKLLQKEEVLTTPYYFYKYVDKK